MDYIRAIERQQIREDMPRMFLVYTLKRLFNLCAGVRVRHL